MYRTLPLVFFVASCATAPTPSSTANLFKKEKISQGDEPHLADTFAAPACGSSVQGAYKLCISRQGSISSVDIVQGIPEADSAIVATLKRWRYRPMTVPICFVQNLQFQIDCQKSHPAEPNKTEPAVAAAPSDPEKLALTALPDAPQARDLEWQGDEGWPLAIQRREPTLAVVDKDDNVIFERGEADGSVWVQRVRFHRKLMWRHALQSDFMAEAAMVVDKEKSALYLVHYGVMSSGATVVALDLGTGQERWTTSVVGLGPIAHSKYSNHVVLKLVRGALVAYGNEAAGRYIEVFDPQTGKMLSTHKLPAAGLK